MYKKEDIKKDIHFLADRTVYALGITREKAFFLVTRFLTEKGENALKALKGFYLYAVENNLEESAISSTLAHDLGGATDKWMLPRSDDYIKFYKSEEELSPVEVIKKG